MKILILYHSGVGSTKAIASMIYNGLPKTTDVTLLSIENIKGDFDINNYDSYIIGFPTYHASPSRSILSFINSLNPLINKKPTFIFTTCGLYSSNTLRIFSKVCLTKNLIPVMSKSYRCPSTDGTLVAPKIKFLFTFKKNIEAKLNQDVSNIMKCFNSKELIPNIPPFKFYSILNYPNKLGGAFFKPTIYIHHDNCTKCYKCVNTCPHNCFLVSNFNFPIYYKADCEHCYRCIHGCPSQALSLSKKKTITKQLTAHLYTDTKK